MKTKYFCSLILILITLSCSEPTNEKHEKYDIITHSLGKECEIYIMKFKKKELFERIALSGYCKGISSKDYIDGVKFYLDSTEFSSKKAKGKIIFEFYDDMDKAYIIKELNTLFPESEIIQDDFLSRVTLEFKGTNFYNHNKSSVGE